MQSRLIILIGFILVLISHLAYAALATTTRIPEFSNDKVTVWKTIIYPSANQVLKMHRHEHDRVLVAFNSGLLKISNDKGKVHYLKLKKDKAYYLTKDVPNELHNDQNMSSHPIKVLVVELSN